MPRIKLVWFSNTYTLNPCLVDNAIALFAIKYKIGYDFDILRANGDLIYSYHLYLQVLSKENKELKESLKNKQSKYTLSCQKLIDTINTLRTKLHHIEQNYKKLSNSYQKINCIWHSPNLYQISPCL